MDHNRGVDLRPGEPRDPEGREKDAEKKSKSKKKKKKKIQGQVTNFQVPVSCPRALEGLRVRGLTLPQGPLLLRHSFLPQMLIECSPALELEGWGN